MSSRSRRLNSAVQRGLDHIGGVLGTERLGQDVLDAGRFEDGAHGLARDDAGARRGRPQQDFRAAIVREDFVRNGRVLQRHADHLRAGHFAALANGIRHFAGLAQADAHAAVLVADDDQRAEIEAASAFDDFGGAIDEHDLLGQLLPGLLVERGLGLRPACAARGPVRVQGGVRRSLLWLVQPQYSFPLYVRIADLLRALRRPALSPCHGNARRRGQKPPA